MDERLHIIIDTREQRPWSFQPSHAVVSVQTLPTGDYALAGDMGFAIERKSLDDFVGTIGSGWDRFQRELHRMAGWPARVIIVEATLQQAMFSVGDAGEIQPPQHSHPRMSPQFVLRRLGELTMAGVSVLWAGEPGLAAAVCMSTLRVRRETWRAGA